MRLLIVVALLAACTPGARPPHRSIAADFDGDGRIDRAELTDERDGFRHTFAYLEIQLAGTSTRETAKYKDGRWIWVDHARYPRLASVMHGYGY
jgi:hypothetical protein